MFKPSEIAPLQTFFDLPMAREMIGPPKPAAPFDGMHAGEELTLPVEVQSRGNPAGVPLAAILAEIQKTMPTVKGISVHGGKAVITYSERPGPQEQEKLHGLLRDGSRLKQLGDVAASGNAPETEFERILRDETTPDAEWMRAFRQYAVQKLLKER